MKWTRNKRQLDLKEKFKEDYYEIIDRFLWLPTQINGQWRWLEKASIERTVFFDQKSFLGIRRTYYYWLNYEWK